MAAVVGGYTNIGFALDPVAENTAPLYNDEAVCEALLREIFATYDVHLPVNSLQYASLDVKVEALVLLATLLRDVCLIVSNDRCTNSSGTVVITRKARATIEEIRALGVVTDEQAAVLLRKKEVKQNILLVAQLAFDSVVRYCEQLKMQAMAAPVPILQLPAPTPEPIRSFEPITFEPYRRRNWKHGLCECCTNCGTCVSVWCCPCIGFGKTWGAVEDNGCYGCICTLLPCALPFAYPIAHAVLRCTVREKYRIEGNCCTDCMTSFCCPMCSLVQICDELECMERC